MLFRSRKDLDVIAEGSIEFLPSPYGVMLYERRTDEQVLTVAVNLLDEEVELPLRIEGRKVIGSYEDSSDDGIGMLRSFEAVAYLK